MVSIPQAADVVSGRWRSLSRRVVDEKKRFVLAQGFSGEGEALERLLNAVDELEAFHTGETIHQGRLRAFIRVQTGLDPLSGENSLLSEYQRLIDTLSALGHATPPRPADDLDAARAHHAHALDLLARIFLIDSRLAQIAELAVLGEPTDSDATRLVGLIETPHDLRYFGDRVESPAWLPTLMTLGVLEPPVDGSPWVVQLIVRRLKATHLDALVDWADLAWDR